MGENIEIIDGIEWEEQGPYCKICGAHMGEYYNGEQKPCFINPNNYEDYGTNTCAKCDTQYHYEEGDSLVLSEHQLDLLRKDKGL